jgi:hypothetical protein
VWAGRPDARPFFDRGPDMACCPAAGRPPAWVTGGGPSWRTGAGSRLWAFKDTQLTSRNGTRGTILGGPWHAYRIIGTNARTGNVVLWPTYPWNNGHNFSVLLRAVS